MRKKLLKISMMCLLLCGFFLLGNTNIPSARAAGEVWTFRDGNLSTGLNKDTTRSAVNPAMVVFNNEIYVSWSETNTSSIKQIRVRKYDGSNWTWVDGGETTGINYNTAENAVNPSMIVFDGHLFAIWSETYSGDYVTRVKRYDGDSTWTSIGGSVIYGLNKTLATSGSTSGPSFGVCNGYLYATWVEINSGAYQVRVKRYDGGTTWTFVDGGGYTGLNVHTDRSANKPKLYSINNTLYLIWTEADASGNFIVRVKCYDSGSTWNTVDGGSGLNYKSGNSVDEARLINYNGSLYAYWLENTFVRVKSYNGSAWSTADAGAGFKQNTLNYVYAVSPPAAIPYGNKLYFTWGEDISYDPWPIQTRASYYNSGAMTFIDGNDSTTGLNYNRLQYAYKQAICEYNGALYLAWYEDNGSAYQLRMRSTPLPAVVTSVTDSGNGWYRMGTNFDLYVTFNKAVNVTGTPVIPITLTTGTVNATYISGSGTATLAFRYTVAAGDADADGITVATDISLSGGTIRDTVNSLDANLTLNNMVSTTGVLMDGVAPTRTSTNPADNATGVGCNQNLIIYFSENIVKGTGNIRIRKLADYSIVETIAVTSPSVTVSGNSATIDPSVTLAEGTGYYVTMDAGVFSDPVGNNFAGILTYTVWNFTTVDTTPPGGYTVSIDQPYINNNNKTAMSFTFAGAEVGTTYNYTLTCTGGGGPLTGSGTISSATQQVTGVSTFGLNEGTLTLSVTLTDPASNTGPAVTATVLKDTLMPTGYSVAIDQSIINYANKTAMSFLISGAETGASYTYSITSSGGGAAINGSGTVTTGYSKSVTGIDVTGLNDGLLTVSVTMTDLPGNPGLPVTATVTKDCANRALTVSIIGTGSVQGTSTLGQNYSCASGACPATPFAYGDQVTLTATDSADFHFGGWSGACSAASGSCILDMTADRSVTATFDFVQPIRLSYLATTHDYGTLADAYATVADNDSATLYCRTYDLTGGFNLGRPVTLLLKGGYDVTFGSNASGWTTLQGALTVNLGTLTVEKFVVR